MKLYVIGPNAHEPDLWPVIEGHSVVLAHNPEEAVEASGRPHLFTLDMVVEIPMDEPRELVFTQPLDMGYVG